jgi:hypothetical protein
MLLRQMEQSCEYAPEVLAAPPDVIFLNFLCVAMLKVFSLFCQPRFSSSLILTHRKIISSPPLKSIPS